LHRKRIHLSGGELELGRGLGGSALAAFGRLELAPLAFGGAVAVADVVGERVAEGVPVEVVGVLADELVTVFIVGIGQGTTYLSTYKTNLENWLQDSVFWTDMNAYVSDWSQELFGDFRNYGVAGSTLPTRRDYLNDFLQHKIVLAGAGPDTSATARSYLQAAYSPLANAAWQWTSGFGWTSISADQMENYVSAQTYALRYFSGTTGQTQDHWGFPWAPNNATGISSTDFTAQTGEVLDRLAAAIHDSAQPLDLSDPGIGACGPLGHVRPASTLNGEVL